MRRPFATPCTFPVARVSNVHSLNDLQSCAKRVANNYLYWYLGSSGRCQSQVAPLPLPLEQTCGIVARPDISSMHMRMRIVHAGAASRKRNGPFDISSRTRGIFNEPWAL